ncbi:prepilin-type N-terminal cleavage/methylation domain-containing protein [Cyanobacterium sp. IPPAS B-1200]|uniref:prepilin-type N-terminal cleavage/methylation domain-containing protein n=1 Tax=Cyanobacterium sp. IPPAS B-1200 TaxID=1562720 RepID=UPI0008526727|nr:prepilin-type N-terminal cleavage/methylation domain-containing protein [Cyanobacterium sp. IPPAS B-1200]OEJ78956.1 hypothetical protein A5482_11705 [Cyanobacterium sp. IPPAS B-1200]
MLHLVATKLKLKNKDSQKGFTLIEIIAILVIIGIGSALATPSLINSQRQDRVTQTFRRVTSALKEAQINANRLSTDCEVTINATSVSASPAGCLSETITYDSSIINVSSTLGSLPETVTFDFRGGTSNFQTIRIFRQDYSSPPSPIRGTGKCIVISNNLGMIRTGNMNPVNGRASDCNNPENARYDDSNP